MPEWKNQWTTGNIVQLVTLFITIAGVGVAIGNFSARLEQVEIAALQSNSDSRALIRVEQDVAYIKQAVQNLTRDLQSASSPLPCPPDQPILVASHCRASAGLAFYE